MGIGCSGNLSCFVLALQLQRRRGFGIAVQHPGCIDGHSDGNLRAFALYALDAQLPFDQLRTFAHVDHPQTAAPVISGIHFAHIEADSVILNFDDHILIAAIEKNAGLRLDTMDVFASLQGGIKLRDPALDLAYCAAVISSAKDLDIPPDTIFLGEVGILAQTSSTASMARRLQEAERLGFRKAYTPRAALKKEPLKLKELEVVQVADIAGLYAALTKAPAAKKKAGPVRD